MGLREELKREREEKADAVVANANFTCIEERGEQAGEGCEGWRDRRSDASHVELQNGKEAADDGVSSLARVKAPTFCPFFLPSAPLSPVGW